MEEKEKHTEQAGKPLEPTIDKVEDGEKEAVVAETISHELEEYSDGVPHIVLIADFAALNVRFNKFYVDKTEKQIRADLAKRCPTYILFSITTYGVSSKEKVEYAKPFIPDSKRESYIKKD